MSIDDTVRSGYEMRPSAESIRRIRIAALTSLLRLVASFSERIFDLGTVITATTKMQLYARKSRILDRLKGVDQL